MSQLDKLIENIMSKSKKLRFDELSKLLIRLGYTGKQSGRGGSHYTFRKKGKQPITIPKNNPVNIEYIELVREALIEEGFGSE